MLDTVSLCCRIVLNIPLTAGGTRVSAYGVTPPPRMVMRHPGGGGAEAMSRGAEPLGGRVARRRKRSGRGYMVPFARVEHGLPLRQTFVAAHTGAKLHHAQLHLELQQSILFLSLDRNVLISQELETVHFMLACESVRSELP